MVYFATNRNRIPLEEEEKPEEPDYFGDARGTLQYGVCHVEFKNIPGLSSLREALPIYVPLESRKLVQVIPLAEAAFWRQLGGGPASGERLVGYIHGYNISFRRACQRAAVFQNGAGLTQRMAMFSWPSKGRSYNYTHDEADMAWSADQIEDFVSELIRQAGSGRVDLVAHSLGTRGLVDALEHLACARTWNEPPIDQLVLVAPDIDAATFRHKVDRLHQVARRITLYASDSDKPLKLSQEVHGYPRLGQAGPDLTLLPGIETIDVSAGASYELSGHLYHLYHPRVMADILHLLHTGESAARRPGLEPLSRDGQVYWAMTNATEE
jgi:esterase/lipase superfamily enzyme